MKLRFKKIVVSGLIISMPVATVLCEAKCSEACEEVKYVTLHALESTGPSGDSVRVTFLSSGTTGGTNPMLFIRD